MNKVVVRPINELLSSENIEKYRLWSELKKWGEIYEKELKLASKVFMEENGILNEGMEKGGMEFKYVQPFSKNVVDTEKMKSDGIYDKYLKASKGGDYVSIKVIYD